MFVKTSQRGAINQLKEDPRIKMRFRWTRDKWSSKLGGGEEGVTVKISFSVLFKKKKEQNWDTEKEKKEKSGKQWKYHRKKQKERIGCEESQEEKKLKKKKHWFNEHNF